MGSNLVLFESVDKVSVFNIEIWSITNARNYMQKKIKNFISESFSTLVFRKKKARFSDLS